MFVIIGTELNSVEIVSIIFESASAEFDISNASFPPIAKCVFTLFQYVLNG
jgi:hypothetical protein